MRQTKYNLNTLSEKENDIKEITKRIDYIFNRFKMIKNSIDIDITRRDNIDDQFNTLTNDFQNIIESTYNSSQIINKAVIEYSNSEHQIQNLLNQLLDTNTDSHVTDMTKTKNDEVSISGISLLQNWFERLYNQLISKITHVKKFFEDNGVYINNKDYSKSVVEDENTLESNVLDESAIGTYSKSEAERIFRKTSEKADDEKRIKKLQQYIREKGLNVQVTGQLDRATFQAVHMIGIDELKENGFIEEDSYRGNRLNLYAYTQNKPISYIYSSGYSKKKDYVDKSYKQLDEEIRLNNGPKSKLNNTIDIYQYINKNTSPVLGGVKNGANAFNKSLSESVSWYKSNTIHIYQEIGRSSLAKKTFLNSVDDVAGPALKRSSQLSGGIGGVGTSLDALNSLGNVAKDLQNNLQKGASTDEFIGDVVGEAVIFGIKQGVDAASLAAGTAGGTFIGGLIGNAPGATIGGTIGGVTIPATTGVLIDKILDAKINNLTNKERIKKLSAEGIKFGWEMYNEWFVKESK
ncbi:hypothetical protein [Vallitalea maricola]|uniref:Uncharacterized protein n=1 Tax=Vallitalea maricola TaxID=3074433 RepID=A0ACB5UIY9_9FIRM|nr:hypothetical protein AN2V17_20820 [Vallitalea sp. AN17-2]